MKSFKQYVSNRLDENTNLLTLIGETSFEELIRAQTIRCYHSSNDDNFIQLINNEYPIHLGSLEQAKDWIYYLTVGEYGHNIQLNDLELDEPWFIYEVIVNNIGMAPILEYEDPLSGENIVKNTNLHNYNLVCYENKGEGSKLSNSPNLSLALLKPKKIIKHLKIKERY